MINRLKIFGLFASLATITGYTNATGIPATPIDVATVSEQPIQVWYTYTTRLEAPEKVALMPRVSGIIESIEFVEGQKVEAGDLLFKLDARHYQAEVDRLIAKVESARAALDQAEKEDKRARNLLKSNAIPAEQAEARASVARQRKAELKALNAQLQAAKLDLEFTRITSPISGIISRAEITRGNNVTANQTVLTNIVSNNEMHAYFNIDERTWNQSFINVDAEDALPVVLQLTGSKDFTHTGYIDFIDNAFDASTGTLRVRANFKPKSATLRAGAFARVRVASSDADMQILVPDRAVGTDLKNRFVLTVNDQNVLEYRLVKTGRRYGPYRVITEGLNANDVIAVNGPARVGPGMPVQPRNVELDLSELQLTLLKNSKSIPVLAAR